MTTENLLTDPIAQDTPDSSSSVTPLKPKENEIENDPFGELPFLKSDGHCDTHGVVYLQRVVGTDRYECAHCISVPPAFVVDEVHSDNKPKII